MSLTALKVSSGPPDHDGQGTFGQALGSQPLTGRRTSRDTFFGEFGGDPLTGFEGNGLDVHEDNRSGGRLRLSAALAEDGVFDFGGVAGRRGDDDIAVGGRYPQARCGPFRTAETSSAMGTRADIVDDRGRSRPCGDFPPPISL